MKQHLRRMRVPALCLTTALAGTALGAGLLGTSGAVGASCTTASKEQTLTARNVTNVRPSGKTARLAVVRKPGSTVAYLTLSVRQGSRYVEVRRKRLSRPFRAGSRIRPLRAEQLTGSDFDPNGGQGQVSWDGPTDATDYSEYFGWNVAKRVIDLFGVNPNG
jgi:hypothetical protein